MNNSFTVILQNWYLTHKRPLPWRDISDPYLIWLSEIILQQTRVAQGLPYYQRFASRYPTVQDLAAASEDEVLQLWQGLGYYSRGRNLLKCAQQIVKQHDGVFPNDLKEVKKLPGIGDYSASAILSFAFNQPQAVLDGNVYRVLSRYFGIAEPIQTPAAHKIFKSLAIDLLDKIDPAQHNQAIMEFGALQCTPKSPDCPSCPFLDSCIAARDGLVDKLPVKTKAKKKTIRHFNYLVFSSKGKTIIQRRGPNDIWFGLYEFPLIEGVLPSSAKEVQELLKRDYEVDVQHVEKGATFKHLLTHQTIYADFWVVRCSDFNFKRNSDTFEVDLQALGTEYAIPVLIKKYLESP